MNARKPRIESIFRGLLIAVLLLNAFDADLLRPTNSDGIIGTGWVNGEITYYGYYRGHYDWQFGKSFAEHGQYKEEIADMFVGWVYGMWENSDLGRDRAEFMHDFSTVHEPGSLMAGSEMRVGSRASVSKHT
jgi:hypothetical protein